MLSYFLWIIRSFYLTDYNQTEARINRYELISRIMGYKYTKSISVKERTDLSIPLGGSGKICRKKTYGIARCRGSS